MSLLVRFDNDDFFLCYKSIVLAEIQSNTALIYI